MNVQLASVISDIFGKTGQMSVRAIIAGEGDGEAVAKVQRHRIRRRYREILTCHVAL